MLFERGILKSTHNPSLCAKTTKKNIGQSNNLNSAA
jgi:hypothetical protein